MYSAVDTEFPHHMTYQQAQNLTEGDVIDHRDTGGWFVNATIIEKQGSMCNIHYNGWPNYYNSWSSIDEELSRFAPQDSISRRRAHRLTHLKCGDYLEIKLDNVYLQSQYYNPVKCMSTNGWIIGKIKQFDTRYNSGQVKIHFEKQTLPMVWIHLDNTKECDELGVHTNTPICLYCNKGILISDKFVSPNCSENDLIKHYYHNKCASKIINESLSLFNEIPKCVKCKKSFNKSLKSFNNIASKQNTFYPFNLYSLSETVNDTLLLRYKMNQSKSKQYKTDNVLVFGYIRHNKNENMLFPIEIINLIHDFYKLVIYSTMLCNNCNSLGVENYFCCANGKVQTKCTYKYCANGKVPIIQDCNVCIGNKGQLQKIKCNCSMNFFAVCKSCNGYGFQAGYGHDYGGRNYCFECDGSGEICPNNCLDGYYVDFVDCNACCGSGMLHTIETCSRCNGKGNINKLCSRCCGNTYIKMKCQECNGNGSLFYTDFNKIISKQKRCHKCNIYYTNDRIIYWSGCHHIFCDVCILDSYYVEDEIESDNIPICPIKCCNEELTEQGLQLMYKYFGRPDYQLATLLSQLNMLIFKKNNFECDVCSFWHMNQGMIILSCGCKCSMECTKTKTSIQNSVDHNAVPLCDNCYEQMHLDDIKLICGKNYADLVQVLIHNQKFETLITMQRTHINPNDTEKVLKLRHPDLHYDDILLSDKIIDFLSLTNIKIEDIEYLNIISTKSKVPLFQLFLKNKTIARNIYSEILNLIQKNSLYQKWNVGFWQIYKPKIHNQNYRGYNGRQYNYETNNNNTSYRQNNVTYYRNNIPNNTSIQYRNNNYSTYT
eukprot:63310_1